MGYQFRRLLKGCLKLVLGVLGGAVVLLVVLVCVTLWVSPRPAVGLIRLGFDWGGLTMSQALEKHVPSDVVALLNEHYDLGDEDAYLDVFYPAVAASGNDALPTIIWVHGGGWISGDKGQVANYLQVLAGKGYTVVGVNYSIAPGKQYPIPLMQVNTALAYVQANAERLHVDTSQLYLAGDSAGAQIAAQVANMVSELEYAEILGMQASIERKQLRGVVLYCGAYDVGLLRFEGAAGVFLKTVLWSYAGTKDFMGDGRFAVASVGRFVTPAFPPTFISVGNADPLAEQSYAMAEALEKQGVAVDALFFTELQRPALGHEYQFNLDTQAGRQALERSLQFLAQRQGSE